MAAWDRTDVDGLVALLADEARVAMPPTPAWFSGRDAIRTFLANTPLAPGAPRHIHVPTRANRQPAFGVFVADADGAPPRPLGVSVLRVADRLIAEIDIFLRPELVERFAIAPPT
jgi:RNA polymerase sigma-70 factor (ECF subfamily)